MATPSLVCILYSVIVLRGNGSRARATPASVQRFFTSVCVPFIINQTPAAGGDHCHGPQRAAFSGLWAIPSTESGPQPLLVTYNLSSLALTPGEPTPYVCMYVSMVHTHMWYVRGYVLGEEGVNASTSRGRNSKLEG